LNFDSSQKFSTLFGKGGIDVNACSDLKPRRCSQLRDDDEIPMVVFDITVFNGGRSKDIIVIRIVQTNIESLERLLKHEGKICQFFI
jgi:hypothetical protein